MTLLPKNQDPNIKNQTSSKSKTFDLLPRTLQFAKDVREFVRVLPKTLSNFEDVKQLIRSSGSVGANYIEANEALGKKDFAMHIKISRKEAKESRYWLELIHVGSNAMLSQKREVLMREALEFIRIFTAILGKVS